MVTIRFTETSDLFLPEPLHQVTFTVKNLSPNICLKNVTKASFLFLLKSPENQSFLMFAWGDSEPD